MSSRDATPVAASRRLVGRQSIFGLKPLERLDAVSGVSGGIHIYMDTSDTPALALIALRNAVYSPEFRRIVSKITGVNDLIERVDCSANAVRTSECKFHLPTRFYSVLQYAHSMQTVAISSVTMTSSGRVECLT